MSSKLQGPIIGIDLGTTNSCVAVIEGTEPRVIANAEGARTTPSIVAFTEKGEVLVGDPARRQAVTNSENTLYATKRYIGRLYQDKEVQSDIKNLPFKVIKKGNDCWFLARGKEYSPSQIAGFVLSKMKSTAESYLGMNVKNAVVTVPAYFNESQRKSTKEAGTIAGLHVARIINEPTAAALAYGIAVFDLGGGTFDISILDMHDGVYEVKSTNGDTHLGGEDFDNIIVSYLCDEIRKKFNTDPKQDRMALQRIKEAAEKCKTELSFSTTTQVNLPYLIGTNSFQATVSRAKLEALTEDLIQKTVEPCKIAIKDSGLSLNEINEVILVGGMTRMPKVQEMVSKIFGKQPSKGVNPDEAVAMGAAIQGGVLTGNVTDLVLLDVTSLSLGVNTVGDRFVAIITKNSTIPVERTKTFTTSADNQDSVEIEVFQGERLISHHNDKVGKFILGGIPPMPRGVPKIEVTFDLDNNGLLNVSAKELSSGAVATATLKHNPGGLTKEQLEAMAKEAEKHLEEDKKRVETIELKNKLDTIIFDTERYLTKNDDKISQELKDECRKALTESQPMTSTDFEGNDQINSAIRDLENILIKLKSEVTSKSQTQQQQQKSTSSSTEGEATTNSDDSSSSQKTQ